MRLSTSFVIAALVSLAACSSGAPKSDEVRTITGVITSIDTGDGFGEVDSFEIKDGDEIVLIYVDPDAVYDFPMAHLNAHRAGAEPVRVEAESRDGKLIAVSISDA